MTASERIIRQIENAIDQKNVSIYAVAEKAECSYRMIYYWLNGERKRISLDMADRILRVLGETAKIGGEEE